jgi:tetrahydromethanopterin S-methyltransferase subunit G
MKVPASKVVDAEIAGVRARVTEVEREFEALQGEWQGK